MNFKPLTDELTLGTIIITLYDDQSRFIDLQSKTIDLKMLMNGNHTFSIPKTENASLIKVYIWDSLGSLKPLSNYKTF